MLKDTPDTYKVERKTSHPNGWYECMLSPFKTFHEAVLYIEKYRHFYPIKEQNYKITYNA